MDAPPKRGAEVEGWAFTFCKAAFLALLFGKYAVVVLSIAASVLYAASYLLGVRQWRCWVKPPWVVFFLVAVAAVQIYFFWFSKSGFII